MDPFIRSFLRSSLAWLALGVTLGVAMAVYPAWIAYRPAHLHMNLVGFVGMMIFGVAYHVLPRFAGRPLHSRPLAAGHWWVANLGLAAMVAGFALRVHGSSAGTSLLAAGGLAGALGAYAFAYNIWRTMGSADEPLRHALGTVPRP
jgi:cbb3-type cytochrome oxidase subunit 1